MIHLDITANMYFVARFHPNGRTSRHARSLGEGCESRQGRGEEKQGLIVATAARRTALRGSCVSGAFNG